MSWKTSSIRKQLFLQDLRQVGWIGIVYLAALLFVVPIQVLMRYTNPSQWYGSSDYGLFDYLAPGHLLLVFSVPVILAVLIFRYLQKKLPADFFHSLPIKRSALLHYHSINGAIILIVPVLITAAIVLVLYGVLDIKSYFTLADIGYWSLFMIFVSLFVFAAAIFVGMVTGLSSLHFVLTYVFLFFPVGIITLIYLNLNNVLIGFPVDYYMDYTIANYSPITYFGTVIFDDNALTWPITSAYVVIGVLLYVFAYLLYRKRPLESATLSIAFPLMRPIFLYGVTICFTLAGGLFYSLYQVDFGWIAFGYVVGALFGYCLAQVLLKKTWRIFGSYKGYLVYLAVLAIAILAIRLNFINYNHYIPEADSVKRVFVGEGVYEYTQEEYKSSRPYLTDAQSIEAVQALQESIIQTGNPGESYNADSWMFLVYELKNGDRVVRSYSYNSYNTIVRSNLQQLEEVMEYKRAANPILRVGSGEVESMQFRSNYYGTPLASFTKQTEDFTGLVAALQHDTETADFDQTRKYAATNTWIEIKTADENFEAAYNASYSETSEWLREHQLYESVVIDADDIENMQILSQEDGVVLAEVSVAEDVQTVLDNTQEYSDNGYEVSFTTKASPDEYWYMIAPEDLPASIQAQLKE